MEWSFLNMLFISLTVAGLTLIHELGHILAAKQMKMRIFKIGAALGPIPHVFVAAEHPKEFWKRFIYLMAGSFITLTLFILFLSLAPKSVHQWMYLAFALQIIIETNPFYSDFTIITGLSREEYIFSSKWYIHFTLWMGIILLLIQHY